RGGEVAAVHSRQGEQRAGARRRPRADVRRLPGRVPRGGGDGAVLPGAVQRGTERGIAAHDGDPRRVRRARRDLHAVLPLRRADPAATVLLGDERAAVLHGVRLHRQGRARAAGRERVAADGDPRLPTLGVPRALPELAGGAVAAGAAAALRLRAAEDVLAEAVGDAPDGHARGGGAVAGRDRPDPRRERGTPASPGGARGSAGARDRARIATRRASRGAAFLMWSRGVGRARVSAAAGPRATRSGMLSPDRRVQLRRSTLQAQGLTRASRRCLATARARARTRTSTPRRTPRIRSRSTARPST